jgi:hypothetical protein
MTPPFIPRALIAAAAPPTDYDVIEGDLHEEYIARVRTLGAAEANRWYWSQALRSIFPLLSCFRVQRSVRTTLATSGIVVVLLFAMLFTKDFVDELIAKLSHHSFPASLYFALDWFVAAAFGLILAAVVRAGGVRLAGGAALFMLSAFALPILIGVSPRLPVAAWVLLVGAIPAMSLGAATFQVIRRR